jgi:hypothetical protein
MTGYILLEVAFTQSRKFCSPDCLRLVEGPIPPGAHFPLPKCCVFGKVLDKGSEGQVIRCAECVESEAKEVKP